MTNSLHVKSNLVGKFLFKYSLKEDEKCFNEKS